MKANGDRRNGARFASGSDFLATSSSLMFSAAEADHAYSWVAALPGYRPTPLHELSKLAGELAISRLLLKDESERFGVGSFKGLGAGYAALRALRAFLAEQGIGGQITITDLLLRRHAISAGELTIVAATAGNYGRALAWACDRLGVRCKIVVPAGVGDVALHHIAKHGAEVVRLACNYDEAVACASAMAECHGWCLLPDTATEGAAEPARWVAAGYSVLVSELGPELDAVSHILAPAGVGGLAASIATSLALRREMRVPKLIVVEPMEAACLLESALAGERRKIRGALCTALTPLACGEPSPPAWDVLKATAAGYVAIEDALALEGATILAAQQELAASSLGLCSGAGLGALLALLREREWRDLMGLGREARVLLLGTDEAAPR